MAIGVPSQQLNLLGRAMFDWIRPAIEAFMRSPNHGSQPMTQRDTTLAEIAARLLHLETLETRNSDSLDFHDMAVWSIKAALEAAFEAGRQSRESVAPRRGSKGGKVFALTIKSHYKSTT
jgi:hypothetical protein